MGVEFPRGLRDELVECLLRHPWAQSGSAGDRVALLAGIPTAAFLLRNHANASGDLSVLIEQLADSYSESGEWRLLRFVGNALPAIRGSDAGRDLESLRARMLEFREEARSREDHPAEVAQVHLFDLRKTVAQCAASLIDAKGLRGFVVATPTPRLMPKLGESLKFRGASPAISIWGRGEVALPTPIRIDVRHTAVSDALKTGLSLSPTLTRKHVIWAVYIEDLADAQQLWIGLQAGFAQATPNRMVVIFGVPAKSLAPAAAPGDLVPRGMEALPPPCFTEEDVLRWVARITKAQQWPDDFTRRWTAVIVKGYNADPESLPIEELYQRLDRHAVLVARNRDFDALRKELDELDAIGG